MKAVRTNRDHKSRKPAVVPAPLHHFASMKELAYEKLKKQQLIEQDLKHTFNLQNHANSRQLSQNVRLKSSGKLKCAIYNNLNHLTVHIIEARQLKVPNAAIAFDTYVKITMLPDVEQRFTKYQTPVTKCVSKLVSGGSLSSLSNASSSNSTSDSSLQTTGNANRLIQIVPMYFCIYIGTMANSMNCIT